MAGQEAPSSQPQSYEAMAGQEAPSSLPQSSDFIHMHLIRTMLFTYSCMRARTLYTCLYIYTFACSRFKPFSSQSLYSSPDCCRHVGFFWHIKSALQLIVVLVQLVRCCFLFAFNHTQFTVLWCSLCRSAYVLYIRLPSLIRSSLIVCCFSVCFWVDLTHP